MLNKNINNIIDGLPIKIFADGPTIDEMTILKTSSISGYTFNPTLFKKLKVTNYLEFCKKIKNVSGNKSISLEVIADEFNEMVMQARILSKLGRDVYVKIPISFTSGKSTVDVIKTLTNENIRLNITAIFTLDQINAILPYIKNASCILSIFGGRIFDLGLDAVDITGEISEMVHANSNCKVLWASPRMVYDIINACDAHCDIITMQSSLIKKLSLFGKTPNEYSMDTVRMFYNDATESGYKL